MSTSGDVQYIDGISWFIWGDIMNTLGGGGVFSTSEGNHEYIGGGGFMLGSKLIKVFDLCWKPSCTEHPPMYSWYRPTCIMISLRCTEHPSMYSWYPPMYLWYPYPSSPLPRVLNTHYLGSFFVCPTRKFFQWGIWKWLHIAKTVPCFRVWGKLKNWTFLPRGESVSEFPELKPLQSNIENRKPSQIISVTKRIILLQNLAFFCTVWLKFIFSLVGQANKIMYSFHNSLKMKQDM